MRRLYGYYRLINGRLYHDVGGARYLIGSFCIDDEDQGVVVVLPIVSVGRPFS